MQRYARVLPSGVIDKTQTDSRNSQTAMLPQQTSFLLLPQTLQAAATTPTSGKETA